MWWPCVKKKKILRHWFGVKYIAFNSLGLIYGTTTDNGARGFQAKKEKANYNTALQDKMRDFVLI